MKYLFLLFAPLILISCGPSDEKIQQEVTTRLASQTITASVAKGVVTLTGQCPDEPCKSGAETSIKDVKGVKSVVNNVTVAPPPPPVAAEPEVTADTALTASINELLKKYPTVKADIADGVVTLTGEIRRSQLQQLLQEVDAAKPRKRENKLTIK